MQNLAQPFGWENFAFEFCVKTEVFQSINLKRWTCSDSRLKLRLFLSLMKFFRRNTWTAKSYNTSFSVNTQSWQCWHFCSTCNLNKLKIATVQFFVENFNWLREDVHRIGVFTNSPQHKNANIANFVLTLPLERNWTDEVCKLKMFTSTDI